MAQVVQRHVLLAEKQGAVVDRARAELELEKQRIAQIVSILSDFSTQAMLLAGIALGMVGGESLESIDDEHEFKWTYTTGKVLFLTTSGIAAATSIWVIFISSHLTSLTRDAALKKKIRTGRRILEEAVNDVRGILWLSLGSLLASTVTMTWLNASMINASAFTFVTLGITWQALLKQQLINEEFRSECGSDWVPHHGLADFWRGWSEPFGLSILCCWRGDSKTRYRRIRPDSADESRVTGGHADAAGREHG
jgi:hypothetical protein